jgi:large subunit ribosomal protein L24
MRIKVGDTVQCITGDDRGQTGKVIRVLTTKGKIVVEGMNKVFKHVKRSQKNPQGGRLSMEMPIHVSNVKLVDATTGKPTRVGMRLTADGSKERFAKVSGASAGIVTPSKAKRNADRKKK